MAGVRQLMIATKVHDGTLHPSAPLLVDISLSMLGQLSERFRKYEKQIRGEYSLVDESTFTSHGIEILDGFLARP